MSIRDEFIVETWERSGTEVVGASELHAIQVAIHERFGSDASPASIARVLADHGARLRHPEILQSDSEWRRRQQFFTADDLVLETIEAAAAFIEKLESLERGEQLRHAVREVKFELDALAVAKNTPGKRRDVARETSQWLTVWLQNPQIFADWLALRRNSPEFHELFGTFPPS
jgi:hypothetical protein